MNVKHKSGLFLLFSTEMWERFSFYVLRGILPLYITATVLSGGLAWSDKQALLLVAFYSSFAYLTPVLGGYFSDRYLGQRRSAMIGAWMMAVGHFLMAFNVIWVFYVALLLVAVGNGFFKPCLTSILGQLYDDADESQRDAAYSLFYMGINIGAALSGLVSGWLLDKYGYDAGFIAAGFAMLVALVIFWWGKERFLGDVGKKPQVVKKNHVKHPLSKQEWGRLGVVFFLFFVTIFFFIAWDQLFGLMILFIKRGVNRMAFGYEIPTLWLANLDPVLVIIFAPILTAIWTVLGKRGLDPFVGIKIGLGCFFTAFSFFILSRMAMQTNGGGDLPHWGWVVLNQIFFVIGELCFIPISWAIVTRITPKQYISRVMGLMLAAIGIGSFLAGYFGSFREVLGDKFIFDALTFGLFVLGVICVIANKTLKKMCHE